ncbi:MAG: hypothetical protein CK531_01585 [Gemmatimonadetes bacterium]|nr:MAG: hypothetical protein CK531_01585 [Gemmatimonadota bacterium]
MMRGRWIAPVLWALLIETLTSWPNVPSASTGHGFDKVVHFGLYAVFAFLVVRAAQPAVPGWRVMGVVLVVLCVWAALDEWHQTWIPGRGAEVADWAADATGVVVGLLIRRLRSQRVMMGVA